MKGIFAILGGLGIGAGLMYLLDPEKGNQRRALIRDKVAKLNRQAQESVGGRVTDLTNRAQGMLHEAKSAFGSEGKSSATDPQQTTFS